MNEFVIKRGYISQGDSSITGSLVITGGVTGSFSGSYVGDGSGLTGVEPFPFTGSALITGSLAVTGSFSVSNNTSNILIVSSSGLSTFTNPTQLSGNLTTSPLITLNQSLVSFGNNSVMLRLVETSVNNSFSVALYKRSGTNETHLLTGGAGSGTNTERTFIAVTGTNTDGAGSLYINKANTNIGYGVTGGNGARLDIKAQGALSTDIAFRVRNSADDRNLFSILGNGDIEVRTNRVSLNQSTRLSIGGSNSDNAGDFSAYTENTIVGFNNTNGGRRTTIMGSSNTNNNGVNPCTTIGYGNSNRDNGIVVGHSNALGGIVLGSSNTGGSVGRTAVIGDSNVVSVANGNPTQPMFLLGNGVTIPNNGAVNNCVFLSAGNNSTAPFNTFKNDNLLIGSLTPWTANFDNNSRGVFYTKNGTAPTTLAADTFGMYSADIVAGNAAPHFRTEVGDVIKLYKQSSAGIATVADLVTVLTNLGLLG